MKLRPYQNQTLLNIFTELTAGVSKQLIVLGVGLGKTVCFASIPKERPDLLPMLVLAHRDELLDQAADKILTINPELTISKEKAESRGTLDTDVVVASVQTLGHGNEGVRLGSFPSNHFKTIVVDEAHHAAAKSYRTILDYFTPTLLLGVTATPQRTDGAGLDTVFDKITSYYPMEYGIDEGYLCSIRGYRVNTGVDITDVGSSGGDYSAKQLAAAIDTEDRNSLVVGSFKQYLIGRPTLVFATSVAQAERIKLAFIDDGITAACITGETARDDRKKWFERLRNRSLAVLINVGVLTEGFDEPCISGIILARPTKSTLLLTQIVGRGTRLHEDKDDCIIVDLADVTRGRSPAGLPSLLGLPPDFDLEGESLQEAKKFFQELEEANADLANEVRSMEDIQKSWEKIEFFSAKPIPQDVLDHSSFMWHGTGDGYSISPNKDTKYSIKKNILNHFTVEYKHSNGFINTKDFPDLKTAFHYADSEIRATIPAATIKLLDLNAQWHGEPPTEKQLKFLKRKKIPVTTETTKGEASRIIDEWIRKNPRSPIQDAIIERTKRAKQVKW